MERVRVDVWTVVAGGLLLAAITVTVPEGTFLALPAFAILVFIAAQGDGNVCRILSSKSALFLGRISYSLYIVHWPVLVFWRYFAVASTFKLPWTVANVLLVAITLTFATALHHLAEVPSHRWARQIGRNRKNSTMAVSLTG